jgi:hypothetical protein
MFFINFLTSTLVCCPVCCIKTRVRSIVSVKNMLFHSSRICVSNVPTRHGVWNKCQLTFKVKKQRDQPTLVSCWSHDEIICIRNIIFEKDVKLKSVSIDPALPYSCFKFQFKKYYFMSCSGAIFPLILKNYLLNNLFRWRIISHQDCVITLYCTQNRK